MKEGRKSGGKINRMDKMNKIGVEDLGVGSLRTANDGRKNHDLGEGEGI